MTFGHSKTSKSEYPARTGEGKAEEEGREEETKEKPKISKCKGCFGHPRVMHAENESHHLSTVFHSSFAVGKGN